MIRLKYTLLILKKCKDITFKPVDIKIPGKTYLEAYKLYFETEIKNYKKRTNS